MTRKYGFHFISLVAIVIFMMWGYTAILSVAYAIMLGILLSYIRRDTALTPAKHVAGLRKGHNGCFIGRSNLRHRRHHSRRRHLPAWG